MLNKRHKIKYVIIMNGLGLQMSLGLTHGTPAPIILRGSNLNLEDPMSNASRSHINAKWFVVPVRLWISKYSVHKI